MLLYTQRKAGEEPGNEATGLLVFSLTTSFVFAAFNMGLFLLGVLTVFGPTIVSYRLSYTDRLHTSYFHYSEWKITPKACGLIHCDC